MRFSSKTLHDLEWPRLLDHLAARCTSDLAADACRNLPFLAPDDARGRLALVAELMTAIRNDDPPPSLPAMSVAEALAHVRGKGMIPPEALRAIASNLKLYASIARYLQNRRDTCPLNEAAVLREGGASPVSMSRLAAEIDSTFDPDGNISDSASPTLGKLRQRVTSLRKHLLARMTDIAEEAQDLLQDNTVTIRNDRFVLPVRTDAHRRLSGIVHGSSQTGSTVFVEPEQVVSIGNDLMLAREEVIREEVRILTALREAVADEIDDVAFACVEIVEVETRIAGARLAFEMDAAVPARAPSGNMEIRAGRHPLLLLEGVKVIPGNIEVLGGQTVLISGPNAGGKTVALKTVGLFGLMLRAGLPVTADPSSMIGMPDNILTDIGDDQSLELNLSTFSAHMKNIAGILEEASPGCIVLLDELAAGTDPVEGTALAEAILEQLNRLNATTMTTTHYDTLKSRAQDAEGFVNVAMGFDLDEGRPTFEMRRGVPGSSSAIAVARTYGIPERILDRARGLLPEQVRELTRAVEALDRERKQAEVERVALAEQRAILEREERRYRDELAQLKSRQDRMLDNETEQLWSAIKRAREKVREAETTVRRRKGDAVAVTGARRAVNDIASQLDPGGALSRARREDMPGAPARADDLEPGAGVYIVSMGKNGVVDSPVKGNTIYVRAGSLRLRVTVDDLNLLGQKKKAARAKRFVPLDAGPRPDAVRTSDNTLDLRGKRADEAVEATDAFLDAALKDGTDAVFILHGHGTNALKDAVREYLKGSSYASDFRPGERDEGGDGITVVWLR